MKPALAPGPAHHGRTAGRSDGPRNRVQPNVPPLVLHVPSPVLAVLSTVTPSLSPACEPCAHDLVHMLALTLCRDSAEFCRAVGPCERPAGRGIPPCGETCFCGSGSPARAGGGVLEAPGMATGPAREERLAAPP